MERVQNRTTRTGSDDDGSVSGDYETHTVSSSATIPIEIWFIPTKVLHIPLKPILSDLHRGSRIERTVI